MLHGRRRERERIDALLEAAAHGAGGALALVGEAGAAGRSTDRTMTASSTTAAAGERDAVGDRRRL